MGDVGEHVSHGDETYIDRISELADDDREAGKINYNPMGMADSIGGNVPKNADPDWEDLEDKIPIPEGPWTYMGND